MQVQRFKKQKYLSIYKRKLKKEITVAENVIKHNVVAIIKRAEKRGGASHRRWERCT
jgi:hypothetical protein